MTDETMTDRGAAQPATPLPTKEELRERLTREQYDVTQRGGTERAFSGEYWDTKTPGRYRCIVCDTELFESSSKYNSGTGWPSFDAEVEPGRVRRLSDGKFGMVRTEARCGTCDAHLGHVFTDGPATTGERYCMNSASLRLEATAEANDVSPDGSVGAADVRE